MDFGKLKYNVAVKKRVYSVERIACKTLRLTLIGRNDESVLSSQGLSRLRQKRIMRLTAEAQRQGLLLGYDDLNALLLSSVSTLKRDISILKKQGYNIPLRGKRKRVGNSG